MGGIEVGTEFDTFDDVVDACRNAATEHRFAFSVFKRDRQRVILKCKVANCPFSLTAIDSKRAGGIVITQLVDLHYCAGSIPPPRNSQTNSKWLAKKARESMHVDQALKPMQVLNHLNMCLGTDMKYSLAHKVREALLFRSVEEQTLQFRKFQAYSDRLMEVDGNTFSGVICEDDNRTMPPTRRFSAFFVCSGAAKEAYRNMRPFLAVDGTFTKNRFKLTLLLAVGMDCNNNIVIVAWALVPNECREWWSWFLTLLGRALPSLHDDDVVIINDRQKGLLGAMEDVFPFAVNCFCCFHIAENVKTRYGKKASRAFWKLVHARSREWFEVKLRELRNISEAAADYVNKIPHSSWSTYAVMGHRYGHVTSNLAEIANSMLKEVRSLPPLDMVHAIYKHEMKQFYERGLAAQACNTSLCPVAMDKLAAADEEGRLLTANAAHPLSGTVLNPYGVERVVKLPGDPNEAGTCTCKKYEELDLPCKHACAFARKVSVAPLSLCSVHYRTTTYRDTYSHPYVPLDLENLREIDVGPPLRKRQPGRPRTCRRQTIRAASVQARHCSSCGQTGHNYATCSEAA